MTTLDLFSKLDDVAYLAIFAEIVDEGGHAAGDGHGDVGKGTAGSIEMVGSKSMSILLKLMMRPGQRGGGRW